MIIPTLIGFGIIFLTYQLIRLTMASFFSWIFSSITGARTEETVKEESEIPSQKPVVSKPSTSKKKKNKKGRNSPKGSSSASDLEFNEDHFESTATVTLQPNKKGKRKKSVGSTFVKIEKEDLQDTKDSPLDNVGFSFFPNKREELGKNEKITSKTTEELVTSEAKPSSDDIGYSFFQPKDKSSSPKKNKPSKKFVQNLETFEQKTKVDKKSKDLGKSTIIEHYQHKSKKEAEETTSVKKIVKELEKSKLGPEDRSSVKSKNIRQEDKVTNLVSKQQVAGVEKILEEKVRQIEFERAARLSKSDTSLESKLSGSVGLTKGSFSEVLTGIRQSPKAVAAERPLEPLSDRILHGLSDSERFGDVLADSAKQDNTEAVTDIAETEALKHKVKLEESGSTDSWRTFEETSFQSEQQSFLNRSSVLNITEDKELSSSGPENFEEATEGEELENSKAWSTFEQNTLNNEQLSFCNRSSSVNDLREPSDAVSADLNKSVPENIEEENQVLEKRSSLKGSENSKSWGNFEERAFDNEQQSVLNRSNSLNDLKVRTDDIWSDSAQKSEENNQQSSEESEAYRTACDLVNKIVENTKRIESLFYENFKQLEETEVTDKGPLWSSSLTFTDSLTDEFTSLCDNLQAAQQGSVVDTINTIQDETFRLSQFQDIVDTEVIPETIDEIELSAYQTELESRESQICNLTYSKAPEDSDIIQSPSETTAEQSFGIFSMMDSSTELRVLALNDKEHQNTTLYRIEKNWVLQFRLGPTLLGRKVSLFCNYPANKEVFDRGTYYELPWFQDEGCKHSDDTALYAQLVAEVSGSFHYYFTYETDNPSEMPQGSGFFLVDPVLKYGDNETLPLDCIQCQTVLAKSLGPFSTWENKLRVAKESGYNMIHFTPIQELGGSNSSYSLSEQLKLNPIFSDKNGQQVTFDDIETFIAKIRREWKMTSICDIVLNHTANESEWIKSHPETTYNCSNCPYMRPAYLLDAALYQFSNDVRKGLYEDRGIPVEVNTEEHLNAIRYSLHTYVLPAVNIPELYTCDVNKLVSEFLILARNSLPTSSKPNESTGEIKLIRDHEFRRLNATVDMGLALRLYNTYRLDCFDEETRIKNCGEDFKNKLDALNKTITDEVNGHLHVAIENVIAGIRYFRVQLEGPRIKEVSIKDPLCFRYFTDYGEPLSFKDHEDAAFSENGKFIMAHNGWVMDADPLRNFAASDSNVYLRRELIAWGDSVKLRFGEKPEDSPFLWNHMKKYVEQTAKIFDGVRLDNCHSTPIAVAEYMLDCARRVRPDLYVVAELFTNSDQKDNLFVNHLGITSLIREAMSAWDSHEEGRLVYRYGGSPVGSFYQPRMRPLVPTVAHALFLDLTHDNPSPVKKRSVFDLLPSSALVNMASCASGSNRGYDELVPHHIHVVDEDRQYTEWTDDTSLQNPQYVSSNSGIIAAKRALNDLHFQLGAQGYNQVYVDQMDPDVVAVTRHNPKTHESVVLVAFTAFGHPPSDAANYQRGIRPLRVEGILDEIILEATLSHISCKNGGSKYAHYENFKQNDSWINGLSEYYVDIKQHISASESNFFEQVDSGAPNVVQLNFKNFKPGSVVAIKVSQPKNVQLAISTLRELLIKISVNKHSELWRIVRKLGFADLNRALYKCDQEERDDGKGFDVYNIPNYGSLVYAGLQGFVSLLANIRPNNDLGHPMCCNLRDGNWMIDYVWKRLVLDEETKELGEWIEANTKPLKEIPRYLVPCYFDVLITSIYTLLMEQSHSIMTSFVSNGSTFVKALAMGSVQCGGIVQSAGLPVLSPNLTPPKPTTIVNEKGEEVQTCVSLSAGLPHFSVGYMRNWGRDTFIALRGLFILTGRYQDARYHILGYAACLRHGLIPNLLDGGHNPRFNCRDAVWWWLHCIKSYVEDAPGGLSLLEDTVSRIFPTDDSPNQPPGAAEQKLYDVIQEALRVHFQGLAFRERNAGRQIDAHMVDGGFNNQIGIHPETGFVFGGNEWNCGTWMDKMGSSDRAGNRGKPATPRDGSAVELIGLSKSVVSWLAELNKKGHYPYDGVERMQKNGAIIKWTFREWSDKIQKSFEKYFWVNTQPTEGEFRPDLINKRGIYKDCYGASQAWTDFQLRCNFPIAMSVAPELFDPNHAWTALDNAEKYLLGPLGMKTLDPEDWAYEGNYDNSNDSDNPKVAHGFNYHQGPEWVWPIGFYLRARLNFAAANGKLPETIAKTKNVLSKHFTELQSSPWRGLPELTNSNGSYCNDSAKTQAWSMSSILEVLHDLQRIESQCN